MGRKSLLKQSCVSTFYFIRIVLAVERTQHSAAENAGFIKAHELLLNKFVNSSCMVWGL
jgi:hypothetical protein